MVHGQKNIKLAELVPCFSLYLQKNCAILHLIRRGPLSVAHFQFIIHHHQKIRRHMQWRTQEFFSGRVQQIQLRTEDRDDGDLGAVTP